MKLGYAPWIENPDPPDYLTPEEIEAMAEKIAEHMNLEAGTARLQSRGTAASVP